MEIILMSIFLLLCKMVASTYRMVQLAFCTFCTWVGGLPLTVPIHICTTSSKSGNAEVFNFEWISTSLTLTSNDVRRPTNPETCASGIDA